MLLGFLNQGSDDVVGFAAVAFEERDIKSLNHAADARKRCAQIFGHDLTLRLVFGEFLVTMSGCVGVGNNRDMRWLLFVKNLEKRLGKTIEGGRVHSLRGKDGARN